MNSAARWALMAAWLLVAIGAGVRAAPPETAPTQGPGSAGGEPQLAEAQGNAAAAVASNRPHEALLARPRDDREVFAEKLPPAPITERPGDAAPSAHFQWIQGYWDWDSARREYVWVTGTWRVPPPGKFWVDGFWRHVNARGWQRVPGFWSEREDRPAAGGGTRISRDWRRLGPPPSRPIDSVESPPAPDFFYVPGEFFPDGEAVVWRPGFWYHNQPGWEWNPAHWVRQAGGWSFRDGSWRRLDGVAAGPSQVIPVARRPQETTAPGATGIYTPPFGSAANPLLSAGTQAIPDAQPPAGGGPGTTPASDVAAAPLPSNAGGGTVDPDVDHAAAENAGTDASTKPGEGASPEAKEPVGTPAPGNNAARYYYPNQWNYPYWGGPRFGVAGYLRQFLPF